MLLLPLFGTSERIVASPARVFFIVNSFAIGVAAETGRELRGSKRATAAFCIKSTIHFVCSDSW